MWDDGENMLEKCVQSDSVLPKVSVILFTGADPTRDKFLFRAINSVLEQNISNEFYNFLIICDNERIFTLLDNYYLSKINVKVVPTLKTLGAKVKYGIEHSDTDLLSFIEDDDEFYPDKLSEVVEEFSKDESLIYLHDNYITIDYDSKIIKVPSQQSRMNFARRIIFKKYEGSNLTDRDISELVKAGSLGNNSCITIRKGDPFLFDDDIVKINYGIDTILLFKALSSNGRVAVCGKFLTKYRVYGGNTSTNFMPVNAEKDKLAINPTLEYVKRIARMSKNPRLIKLSDIYEYETKFLYILTQSRIGRLQILKKIIFLLKISGLRNRKFELNIFYKACLALISQKLMRKFVSLMRGS